MVDGYENTSLLRTPEFGGTINRARPGAWGCLDGFGVRKMIGSDPVNLWLGDVKIHWGILGVLRFDGHYMALLQFSLACHSQRVSDSWAKILLPRVGAPGNPMGWRIIPLWNGQDLESPLCFTNPPIICPIILYYLYNFIISFLISSLFPISALMSPNTVFQYIPLPYIISHDIPWCTMISQGNIPFFLVAWWWQACTPWPRNAINTAPIPGTQAMIPLPWLPWVTRWDLMGWRNLYLVGGFKDVFHNICDNPSHWLIYTNVFQDG